MIRIESWRRFIGFLVVAALLVLLAVAGIVRLIMGPSTIQHSGELHVAEGSSAAAIWREAVAQEFTPRTLPWRWHAWRQGADAGIKAGTYQLTAGESVAEVVARLVAGRIDSVELTLTYPEGFTIQQMAARTAAAGIGTEDQFIQAAAPSRFSQEEFPFLQEIPPGRDLEGYLFPDTYHAVIDDTPEDVLRRMLATFDRRLNAAGLAAESIAATGRSLDQIIIMASIIEREVQGNDDMALVSGVLWRRFDDGVGLGADATVRYALDHWEGPLTVVDLAVDSPYNTRKYAGLPPGPISNPGLRAIQAAARPEPSDYYYYLSAPGGQTIFSKTLNEHNLNKAKYLR